MSQLARFAFRRIELAVGGRIARVGEVAPSHEFADGGRLALSARVDCDQRGDHNREQRQRVHRALEEIGSQPGGRVQCAEGA